MSRKALFALVLAAVGCSEEEARVTGRDDPSRDGEVAASELSAAEVASLRFMREEEKLARDVYRALDGYGNPFVNVQGSEQAHFDAIGGLLDRYEVEDPSEGKGEGEFENADLGALYVALVEQGATEQTAALIVGCRIEELDIRDIEAAKASVNHDDIIEVYDGLLLGSRNHLRAFYGKLVASGGAYVPQYIDQAAFDAIVTSPRERRGQ